MLPVLSDRKKKGTMNKSTIWKLILNQLSHKESEEVTKEVEGSPTHKAHYLKIKSAWSLSAAENHFSEQQVDKKFKQFRDTYMEKPKSKRILSSWIKYAAVFVISMMATWSVFTLSNKSTTSDDAPPSILFETATGQTAKATLPDGTAVWLNSESKLEVIDGLTNSDERQLKLSGEAFFEVTKDSLRPFIVSTQQGPGIKVLGTSFNLHAYPGDYITTTLVEGSVQLLDQHQQHLAILEPGDQVTYNTSSRQLHFEQVDGEIAGVWKEGILVFKDETLSSIAPKLERFYNVTIIFEKENLKEKKLSGRALKDYPVEKILEMFHMLSNINYRIENKSNEKTTIYIY